ncbi:hypothetical protein [Paucibacter sp. XJ19-41]|uniref:hypothetical protein n=1 Tax=Paucibacter sp. XJ19-41 TaxID=2927824 RepID=UPI0023499771|nr:hypothetical protein [Paucibacter sp. XJ19-41]MDC6166485.1 hypothetical protein [Paucibacter sp. XJ19-41]
MAPSTNPTDNPTDIVAAIRAFRPSEHPPFVPGLSRAHLPATISPNSPVFALPPVVVALLTLAAEELVKALGKRIGERLGDAVGDIIDHLVESLFGSRSDYEAEVVSRLDRIQKTLDALVEFLSSDFIKILAGTVDISIAKDKAAGVHASAAFVYQRKCEVLDAAVNNGRPTELYEDAVFNVAAEAASDALQIVSNADYGISFFGTAIEAMVVVTAAAERLCKDQGKDAFYAKPLAGYARDIRAVCQNFVDPANPKSFIARYTPLEERIRKYSELVTTNCLGGHDFLAGWQGLGLDGAGDIRVMPRTFRLIGWNDATRRSQRTATNRPGFAIPGGQQPTPALVYAGMKAAYPPHDDFPICSWWSPMGFTWSSFDDEAHAEIDRNWAFAKLDGQPIVDNLKALHEAVLNLLASCDYVIAALDPPEPLPT